MIYSPVNLRSLRACPARQPVSSIGCGDGALGRALKARQSCRVVGVTASEDEAREARASLDRVVVHDLETWDVAELRDERAEVVVCSHVLERSASPGEPPPRLPRRADPSATLLVASPNVVHWRQRLRFLRGQFRYTDGGLLDDTHLRFYNWTTARELIESAGWTVRSASADGHFPLLWRLPVLGEFLDRGACGLRPNLFGFQFVFLARPS